MCRPGTSAVAEGTAGFEAEAASRGAVSGMGEGMTTVRQQAGAGPALLPLARSSNELPCRDEPELFFAEAPEDVEYAKALCSDCPVRMSCLAGALERREPWGVWGGELFLRGEVVPRKRPRGRPRKTEVAA